MPWHNNIYIYYIFIFTHAYMCVIKYSKVYTRYDASPFSQNVAVVFIMCVFSGLYLTIDWYWTNSTTRSICLCGLHTLKMMSKRIKYIYIYTASFWHKHCILRRLCLPTLQEYFFLKAWKGRIYNFWHVLHTLSEGLERIGICFLKNSGSSKKRVSWRDRFTCFTALLSYEGSTTCFHGTMDFLTEIMSRRCCIMLHEYSCAFGRGIDSTFWNNCILNVERVYL